MKLEPGGSSLAFQSSEVHQPVPLKLANTQFKQKHQKDNFYGLKCGNFKNSTFLPV